MRETGILIGELVVAGTVMGFMIYNLWAEWSAVAYVPSNRAMVARALKMLGMKKGRSFWDLGSGDGVVSMAVREYGVAGVGIEINPFLTAWARWISRKDRGEARFMNGSFWKVNLQQADYVYCYLSPRAMRRLAGKFEKELKSGARVVSRAFAIPQLTHRLWREVKYPEGRLFLYRF